MIARFDRIVVVAGAQAAGKSTFIRRWQRNRIPASIANALPNGGADWPVVLAKNVGELGQDVDGYVLDEVDGEQQKTPRCVLSKRGAASALGLKSDGGSALWL